MANREHLAILKQGVETWKQFVENSSGTENYITADLSGADLSRMNLGHVSLSEANLAGANLCNSNLVGAYLSGADLTGAAFRGAYLSNAEICNGTVARGADFREAVLIGTYLSTVDLREANFAHANLVAAIFATADLRRAMFHRAELSETVLGNTNLSGATGLDTCEHYGPSIVDHKTLMKSDPLPQEFLRGCGLPQNLQTTVKQLMAKETYYSCFLSYGSEDEAFAVKLRDTLKAVGIKCWIYAKDATAGDRTWREIGERRRSADKAIFICTIDALTRDGVLKELEDQIDEDPEKIVPISLKDDWKKAGFKVERAGKDLKPVLLDRNYVDFANSPYERAVKQLLRGLQRRQG